jgi:hypothetical protein
MKSLKALDILAAAIIIASMLYVGFQVVTAAPRASAAISDGPFYEMTTSSSTQVLTSSKQIAATSTGLMYREIVNFSATPISCAYNDKAATLTTGFFIAGSSSRQWYGETLYTGAIRCIAGATANIAVTEVY